MLGRPHEVRGPVERGGRPGQRARLPDRERQRPRRTFASRSTASTPAPSSGADGIARPAAISAGCRPTFYADAGLFLLEAHFLDFEGDLYGQAARVRFTHRLRGQERFESVDDLVAQMRRDVDGGAGAATRFDQDRHRGGAECLVASSAESVSNHCRSEEGSKARMPDKAATISDNRLHDSDTGSAEVQIALLTERIRHLTEHMKVHKKDFHTPAWSVDARRPPSSDARLPPTQQRRAVSSAHRQARHPSIGIRTRSGDPLLV